MSDRLRNNLLVATECLAGYAAFASVACMGVLATADISPEAGAHIMTKVEQLEYADATPSQLAAHHDLRLNLYRETSDSEYLGGIAGCGAAAIAFWGFRAHCRARRQKNGHEFVFDLDWGK